MSTTTTKTVKTPRIGTAATPFDAFNFAVPSVEVPAAFRDLAEKTIAQARDGYAKFKSAAEDASGVVEDTYETAREGAFALGVKALDITKVNSDASFALARDLFGAKTFAEVIELQTTYARKQFDTVGVQFKELQELAQKFVTEAAKPVTERVQKTFKDLKAA